MRYALYDTYEAEIEPGELICTSDSMAKLRAEETDGECSLFVAERIEG